MSEASLTFDASPEEMVVFLSEAEEQLELLGQDILRLEQEGATDSELLQEIFRAAHTLKGSSGAIGHQRMARLTHAMETVLDQVRHHTLGISTQLINLLFQGVDTLRVLLEEVTTLVPSDIVIEDLCVALNALANGSEAAPAPIPAPTAAPSTPVASFTSSTATQWRVEASVAADCQLPAVRALQILLAAGAMGTITKSEPSMELVENGQFVAGGTLVMWLTATDPAHFAAEARQRIENISEVRVITITPVGEAAPVSAPAPSDAVAEDWQLTVEIDPACPLPAVRALQVVLASGNLGIVVESHPTLEAIEAGQVVGTEPIVVWLRSPRSVEELTALAHQEIERVPEVHVQGVTTASLAEGMAGVVATVVPAVPTNSGSTPVPVAQSEPTKTPEPAAPPTKADHPEGDVNRQVAANHAPRMVRIDVERLDALMNLVGELVIDRTRLARISAKVSTRGHDPALAEELTETCRHLARISDDLQDEVMRSRMLPIESVFSKFPRLMRDLAQKVDKKIDFVVEGKDTELDRSVAEQIGDPIIHLLRNSIDHGIEPRAKRLATGKPEIGQVRLAARHEENQIVIDVEDDGRGINPETLKEKAIAKGIIGAEAAAHMGEREAVDLIFAPGFSTAEQISDISGRGVGMDIVRTNVERLNGSITVETEVGQGTRFTVRLPLTLAIIRALLVEVAGQTYAIPLVSVLEALRVEGEKLRSVNGHEVIELRGQVLPLMRLGEIFGVPAAPNQSSQERQFVVAVRWGERRCGLIVDALVGEQEIVIKPLGNLFRSAHGVSGGAVLGDGQVAPILDVAALIKYSMSQQHAPQEAMI
jgi:two-component system chemotaxis sensor kinase CheA